MHIEVDQSGRLEQSGAIVSAFSNKISAALLIPGPVKSNCVNIVIELEKLKKGRKKRLRSKKEIYLTARLKVFSVIIFVLFKDYLEQFESITIDNEYEGQEDRIKSMLLYQIRRIKPSYPSGKIIIKRIGKKSPANIKAHDVYTGKELPDKKIREAGELLRYLI